MTNDTLFRLITFAMFVTVLSIGTYYRRKAARASNEKISRRKEGMPILILLRLGGLGLWLSPIAYVINPGWMSWSALPLPIELRELGAVMSALAIPMIIWVFRSLGHNVTDTVVTREKHTLVTHGPYRWIRHPLYSFAALFFVGIGLVAANWFILLAISLGFILLAVRTPIEEAELIGRFGDDYRAYMQRTGRFLPHVSR